MRKVLLFSAVVFLSGICLAQSESATLSGRVTDSAGSAVVGAHVVLTNIETNVESRTKTNNVGLYVFTGVHPGKYRVAAGATGFKVLIKDGLVLHVQDELAENFALPLGTVSETVTVNADAALVNTTDASVSTVIDRNFAENLPLNGRSFQTLLLLTPGVVATPSGVSDSGQFSINGQRAASNYWMVDGVSANIGVSSSFNPGNGAGGTLGSFSASGGTNGLVSVDALQEFRIQTSTYAPEFGRTPGGQISIVTRSGTNRFHGTVFDYLRNDMFDASNWFNGFTNHPPLPKAQERQNDFGGTFSGPILKDRTFFFFSYEGLRLRLPNTTLTTVPDLATRHNAIPVMQPFLNAYPLPNGPQATDASGNPIPGEAVFNASYSNPSTLDAYSLRVDHKVSDRLNLFGRYDYSPSESDSRGGTGNLALSVVQSGRITTQTGTIGANLLISPTIVNEARFNYSHVSADGADRLDSFGGAVPLTSLPFPEGFTTANAQFRFFPTFSGQPDAFFVGELQQNIQRQINIVDSLSWQKGPHSLKFGIDYRRLSPSLIPAEYSQEVDFADMPSAALGQPDPFFPGETGSSASTQLLFQNLGIFAQDTWRAAPRLTLTYGLRWDLDFAPSTLSGPKIPALSGYNLNDLSQLAIAPTGTAPFKTTYGNFAPRLGLAYQLNQSQERTTVLRAGFGVFYDLVSSETGNLIGLGFPPYGTFNFNLTPPFPFAPSQIAPPPIPPPSISDVYAFNPRLKLPYTLEWNVAVEQALSRSETVTASYIGARGKRLQQTTLLVSPPSNPGIGLGAFIDNTATSDYDALQLQYQRRVSHGLQALASYTWSHSIDDGSAASVGVASNAGAGSTGGSRGSSDFDIRHSFSAGFTYLVPSPKNNAFVKAVLDGWSLQSLLVARTAPPLTVLDFDFSRFNNGVPQQIRPDRVAGQPLYLYGPQFPGGKALNPAAFVDPPSTFDPSLFTFFPDRQGNLSRNSLRGFGATQWDFAVHREFPIHESVKLQFRAEMFNVLNHPNFGPPNSAFFGPLFGLPLPANFGKSTQILAQYLNGGGTASNAGGGAFTPLYQIGGPRSIQFALKLTF